MRGKNLKSAKKSWCWLGEVLTLIAVSLVLSLPYTSSAWAATKFKTLHRFKGKDGQSPYAGVILDAAGNLYGTTYLGGTLNVGTVFELTPTGDGIWKENVLYSFSSDFNDGYFPAAGVTLDSAGNLYGTTSHGIGTGGFGTVFGLTSNGDRNWAETALYSFGTDEISPVAALIFDSAGNLYGTTWDGGGYGCRTVFELMPNGDGTWRGKDIHSFTCTDGDHPDAGVIFDSAGNLYGTTESGGDGWVRVVFKLRPQENGSWMETVLHSFNGTNGKLPLCRSDFRLKGNLYGTTQWGGTLNVGTVFELTPNGRGSWRGRVLHSFNYRDGFRPYANLIFDRSGNLYGTAKYGGAYGFGAIFKLNPT